MPGVQVQHSDSLGLHELLLRAVLSGFAFVWCGSADSLSPPRVGLLFPAHWPAGQTCNAGGANMCPSCSYVCVPCRFFGESHDRTAEGASSASTCCSRATSRTAGWAGSRPSSSRPGRTSCRWCRCCCCCPTWPTRQAARGHPSSSNNASSSCCWRCRC